jgi:hypothetical protein
MSAPAFSPGEDREPHNEPTIQGGWFSNIPGAVFLGAVVLYVTGWSYLYGFYSAFGVSLDDLGFSLQEIMIFAERVITSLGPFLLIGLFAAVIAAFFLLASAVLLLIHRLDSGMLLILKPASPVPFGKRPKHQHLIVEMCVGIALLALGSSLIIKHGQSDGAAAMQLRSSLLPTARIAVDKTNFSDALLDDPLKDGVIEGYRLLVHGKKGYFLFRPLESMPNLPGRSINVLFVPDDAVLSAQIGTALPKEASK